MRIFRVVCVAACTAGVLRDAFRRHCMHTAIREREWSAVLLFCIKNAKTDKNNKCEVDTMHVSGNPIYKQY